MRSLFGRFKSRSRASIERETGRRVVRDFGEIFYYQARGSVA
ncbi:hypothetical protein BSIN_1619 [Burkholderia singularis]|uniref:Uncharacterized protein n=1 Tax=Burkholderia singularis TaxID=1503053 RepID=A0A238GZB9_9BURK|nr:hypothetical protein BSIN_1619 [Burkholderia singularis]